MNSKHGTVALVAVVVFALSGALQAADLGSVAIEQVLQAWRTRQDQIQSLRIEFTEERVLHRQKDRVPRREHEVIIKGPKLRHQRVGEDWNYNVNEALSPQYISIFDGTRDVLFLGYEEKTNRVHPVGFRSGKVRKLGISSEANNPTVWPIFHTFRFDQPGFIPTDATAWRRAARDGVIGDRRFPVLEETRMTQEPQQYRVWVDPERDFCAVRLEMGPKHIRVTYAQLDIDYDQDPSGVWVPQRWTSRVHCQPGDQFVLEYTARFSRTDYELNPPVDDSAFQFNFPPYTEVMDESGEVPGSYIVLESGIRPIYNDERLRGARYSDLLSTPPGEALKPPGNTLFDFRWLLVVAAVTAVAGWLILRRR
uniref:Uncharacterized protein n=1 Tax=Schlesneria paludicola TaxID=360056 RepID=A0A7C4QSZ2_9PLAN